jgi:hypothetical protein
MYPSHYRLPDSVVLHAPRAIPYGLRVVPADRAPALGAVEDIPTGVKVAAGLIGLAVVAAFVVT